MVPKSLTRDLLAVQYTQRIELLMQIKQLAYTFTRVAYIIGTSTAEYVIWCDGQ